MFLTPDELRELTGYKQAQAIMRWLDDTGYVYHVGADGWPRVLREVVIARLHGQTTTPARRPKLRLE